MRNFLRQNSLALFLSLSLFYSYAAVGGVITRPYGSSDYAGGTKAVGSKVNAEFDTIVNWLNGGNIASDNIAAFGVGTANLANGSVTQIKLATKTVSSGVLTINSTSTTVATAVTGSISVTGTGRPIFIGLKGTLSSTLPGLLTVSSTSTAIIKGHIEIWRDSTVISSQAFGMGSTSSGSTLRAHEPPSSFWVIDDGASSGAHTYTVRVWVNNSGVTLASEGVITLYGYEL